MTEEANTPNLDPWVEKYRPQSIDDIVQQEEVVQTLQATIQGADLPHLLFHGPPGTGKTSTALALCRTIFKSSEFKRRVMELNASDERGIDAIRKKVKQFASLSVPPGGVPYKIIILDEADSMTSEAQNALRRIIETYSSVTRFIIICNYISKIADPILSRCAKFRFKPLSENSIIERLKVIAERESLVIEDPNTLPTLVRISSGDLRKAITYLQSASFCETINSALLLEISGSPDEEQITNFFRLCSSSQWPDIENATKDIVYSGYDVTQILEMLVNIITNADNLDPLNKAQLLLRLSEVDGAINTSRADPFIQFASIATSIWKAYHP